MASDAGRMAGGGSARSSMPTRWLLRAGTVLVLAVLVAVVVAGCGGGASRPPDVAVAGAGHSPVAGLQDDSVYQPGADIAGRIRKVADAGASLLRVDMVWAQVATRRPAHPEDPADPAYRWQEYDAVVRAARVNGLRVLFTVWGTPAWAADRSVRVEDGNPPVSRRPVDPADFGAFATAAARRYAPQGVHLWEGWNEPNIPYFLAPQYERRGGRWVAVSPTTYAALQGAFYDAVKGVDPAATVAGGVTAPAGDRRQDPKPKRVTPDDFIAALNRPGLRPPMDVVSHHPYPQSRPRDETLPGRNYIDLYNLDVLERAIDRTYLRGKGLWVTEYGFGTEPTRYYRLTFTPAEQAAYIADAYRRLRADPRVLLTSYYFLQDQAAWKSGLFDAEGAPKPGLAAFAMPLALDGPASAPAGRPRRLVGQVRPAPGITTVTLEWRSGGDWRPLTTSRTARDGSFALTVTPSENVEVRSTWSGTGRSGRSGTWTSPPVAVEVD